MKSKVTVSGGDEPKEPCEVELYDIDSSVRWTMRWVAVGAFLGFQALAFAIYHAQFVKPLASVVATIDIAVPVQYREAQFTSLLSGPNVSDAQREQAFRLVKAVGPEIEKAVARLHKECGCMLMVKSAVIAGSAKDLTPRLLELMGIKLGAVK